jgi:hypothetical protein
LFDTNARAKLKVVLSREQSMKMGDAQDTCGVMAPPRAI